VVNLPPRSTKSRFASVLFRSWYLGRHPDHKVMECSHTASLALDFGRDVRNLIHSPEYRRIFPKVSLSQDRGRHTVGTPTTAGSILPLERAAPQPDAAATWSWSMTRIRSRTSPAIPGGV
jgi:hypothetical protein